jgi:hypothetical protein
MNDEIRIKKDETIKASSKRSPDIFVPQHKMASPFFVIRISPLVIDSLFEISPFKIPPFKISPFEIPPFKRPDLLFA